MTNICLMQLILRDLWVTIAGAVCNFDYPKYNNSVFEVGSHLVGNFLNYTCLTGYNFSDGTKEKSSECIAKDSKQLWTDLNDTCESRSS